MFKFCDDDDDTNGIIIEQLFLSSKNRRAKNEAFRAIKDLSQISTSDLFFTGDGGNVECQ